VGLIRCDSKTTLSVSLILGIVSFEPDNITLALKCQNMGGDPIKEPPVMADHHHVRRKGDVCPLYSWITQMTPKSKCALLICK
jgi:hypothetical protein